MQLSGALDRFTSFDVTPTIGREFPDADLRGWLESPDSNALLRDLAITVSQRGVVFFRKQDGLNDGLQKTLVQRLGELSGKPRTSGLHIHPFFNAGLPLGGHDNEIDVVSTEQDRTIFGTPKKFVKRQTARGEWHTDITHEIIPSDYAMLRLIDLPKGGGGDTLWASGYELYDRISKPYQKFLEGLTATFAQPSYDNVARQFDHQLYTQPRGSPENVGSNFVAVHPVIRTNPVTGWKSLFAVGNHVQCINSLQKEESDSILQWFTWLITENHDLQVRYRWQNRNDVALWDNRCVFHAATKDIDINDRRTGHRAMGVGERPYLDPKSTSRREDLGLL
ncbi:TauD/TfdA dioxygenase family protein [Aspergillus novofumigatus IBT 16806]|uniref:Putative TfdA family taurine dioxygenase n=1 Tax=Aspergillus novofumigatus (strain IBT 16806) TaxID=1392255 RepID=A0A2I1CF54_ASPN1|nr:putative TfdA family taurine dioxygenase [Aspergillus novofumigatus IBT 16806]PKX96255.1 putative TfdA family taurine dioxygenase [Aspergillus novofumigatus IBT 16806]